jgi:acetyltransferase
MSTYHLKSVFRPKSVAVVGGATRPRSIGRALVGNLVHGGFAGRWRWSTRMRSRWTASRPWRA